MKAPMPNIIKFRNNSISKSRSIADGEQFVGVWEYNGQMWSGTFRMKNGVVEYYLSDGQDIWRPAEEAYGHLNIAWYHKRVLH